MKNLLVRNSKGVSAIEIVFALFISSIAILTVNVFVTQMNTENKKLADNSTATRKNYDFLELMNNPTMWKATVLDVNNYSYYACKLGLNAHPDQKDPVDCATVKNSFRIISAENNVIYDETEKDIGGQTVGFTAEGTKCFGFNEANGNDDCPTHYKISWELPCLKVANCKEPMAKVTVQQITRYQAKTGLNSEKLYNLNVNLPQSVEIAPRDSAFMVNINASQMEFDVLKTDFAVDTFNLKIVKATTSANSTVTIKDNKIVYTPKANFYGVDKIYYVVTQNLFDKITSSEGVVWVKVMTPYTWVGDGPVEETSLSGKKWYNVYEKKNWCGVVVNNKCTYFYPDSKRTVNLLSDAQMKLASLVFNENCNNCSVLLKGLYSFQGLPKVSVNAIEISENFPGEIKQIDNLDIMIRRNSANRVSDDPALLYGFWQKGGSFIGASSKANLLTDEVYMQKRSFQIDRDGWSGNGPRNITRGSLVVNTYGHFSVEGGKFYAPENMVLFTGYNQITNSKYFFHQNGTFTVFPRWSGGNIIDAPDVSFNEFTFNGAGGYDYSIIGNMYVKDMSFYQTGYETQMRGYISNSTTGNIFVSRNIYMRGGGGFMVNGWSGWGYVKIVASGTSDQYIFSNLDLNGNKDRTKIGRLPILVVNKPSGTLHIKGDLGFNTGIDYQAGTIKFYDDEEIAVGDKQMIEFSSTWNTMFIKNTSGKELVLPNIEFSPQCAYIRIETDFRVAGDFIQDKMKYNPQCSGYPFGPQTRKIFVEGDVYAKSGVNEYDYNGLVTLEMTGSKDQKIIGANSNGTKITNNVSNLSAAAFSEPTNPVVTTNIPAPTGYLIHVDVKKSAGKVTMEGAIGFMGRFRVISGDVDGSQATIGFRNVNDCCAPGTAVLDLGGLPGKRLKVKGLHVQRSLTLSGHTLEITDGLNLPAPNGGYNNGSITNGRIELSGNLYYNDLFDAVTTNVNRAKLVFVGGSAQTVFATMQPTAGRFGTFEFEIEKSDGTPAGGPGTFVNLNCQGYVGSNFLMKGLTIVKGNLALNNCSLKASNKIDIVEGSIDRGATPGQFLYGSLKNKGTIVPDVVVGN